MENKKLTFRDWAIFILVGLVGQLAWAIENNEINLWVYSQTQSTEGITWMTTASAIAATLTTFLMGAWSDRIGKRKMFISVGYILWGISVVSFGFFSYHNMSIWAGGDANKTVFLVALGLTVVDCVMTFFGSTGNDACFNAYVTDITSESNRGKVESVLSVLPLFANILMMAGLAIFGASSTIDPSLSREQNAAALAQPWFYFFLSFGVIVTLIGILCLFLLPKDKIKPNRQGGYFSALIYGFRPSVIKKRSSFYIALIAFMAFNCAMDAFMPYYLVYFQNNIALGGLGYSGNNIILFYVAMGVILIVSSLFVLIVGLYMDRIGKLKLLVPALVLSAVGFLGMYLANGQFLGDFPFYWLVIVSGVIMMSGYLIGTAVLGATIRDETPSEEVGLFQGVRMVFAVMVPMIIGSNIAQAFFSLSGIQYTNAVGESVVAPTNVMFLVSFVFIVLAVAPSLWLIHVKKKAKLSQKGSEAGVSAH